MFRRAFCFFLLLGVLGLLPAAAQAEAEAIEFVPADFAGFVRLQADDLNQTQRGMNILSFTAAQLQPSRIARDGEPISYENFLPFGALFEADDATFESVIAPWLDGEVVIAYRDFNGQFGTAREDVLVIAPTYDVLMASNTLSAVISELDGLQSDVYRGIRLYQGDHTTIALTAPAVFIGPADLVKAALDVQAGTAEGLADNPVYQTLLANTPDNPFLMAYVQGSHLLPAISGLLAGRENTEPLLMAFGGTLAEVRGSTNFESMLLNGGVDGAIGTIEIGDVDAESYITLEAKAHFHTRSPLAADEPADTDADLLTLIPQNAMLAGQGTDARGMVYELITALPLSNFARDLLGGLPIQTVGTDSNQITVPDADQLGAAVNGFLSTLEQFGQFNLEADLLSHLSGRYAVALMPRPNNPLPVLNTPFDTLLAAEVSDEEAALTGATTFLQLVLNLDPLESATSGDWTLNRLGVDGQVVIQLGAQDGRLLIGTGEAVVNAIEQDTEDSLIESDAWGRFDAALPLDIYMDKSALFNVFFPQPGGAVPPGNARVYFGLNGQAVSGSVYRWTLTALLPVA